MTEKIKIKKIENKMSFENLQQLLEISAKTFGLLEDEISIEDLQKWLDVANNLLKSLENLSTTAKAYIAQVELEKILHS